MTSVLYILMRTDLASMNAGKAMAQASHAANQFVFSFHEEMQVEKPDSKLSKSFYEWEQSTPNGFGTVLVLGGNWQSDILPAINRANSAGYLARCVFDPTYPIVDGEVVHHIPLHTCAFMFVSDKENDALAANILSRMKLHV